MRHLTLDELDRLWEDVETAIDATPAVDPWCSGLDWQLSVARAFSPDAPSRVLVTDDGAGFALLARYRGSATATVISGLESIWGFGCPILGPNPAAVAAAVAADLAADPSWDSLVIPGLSLRCDPLDTADSPAIPLPIGDDDPLLPVALALSPLGDVGLAEGITRQVIDLDGGYEEWLARRSAKFRRNLRRAGDRADHAGLVIVDASDDPELFRRILAIEERSWKGIEDSGITATEMGALYRSLVDRLRRRRRLRAHVARLGGVDVGYILGGIRARRYRGLQISFVTGHDRLSIGNLLQAHQLEELVRHDLADTYDLGMDFGYKRRWADRAETSLTLVVERRAS